MLIRRSASSDGAACPHPASKPTKRSAHRIPQKPPQRTGRIFYYEWICVNAPRLLQVLDFVTEVENPTQIVGGRPSHPSRGVWRIAVLLACATACSGGARQARARGPSSTDDIVPAPEEAEAAVVLSDQRVLSVGDGGIAAHQRRGAVGAWMRVRDARGNWHAAGSPEGPPMAPTLIALPNGNALVIGGILPAQCSSPGREPQVPGGCIGFSHQAVLWTGATSPPRGTGDLAIARVGHQATVLSDGRVLVTGGRGGPPVQCTSGPCLDRAGTPLASVEIRDPKTGDWQQAAPMSVARARHVAILLQDGRVLAVGHGTAEVWSPSGVWKTVSPPPIQTPTAGLALGDGRAFVMNGRSAATWDPATNIWRPAADAPIDAYTAKLLGDGRVAALAQRNVATWDPTNNKWGTPVALEHPRLGGLALPLDGGALLVLAGCTPSPPATAAGPKAAAPCIGGVAPETLLLTQP